MLYKLTIKATGKELYFKKRSNVQYCLLPVRYKHRLDYAFARKKRQVFEDLAIKVEQFKMED